ncbi:hypothetical protein E1B28_003569 [Marasmius oreades]|uniref:CCR4-NOT transcription complex subunit 11 n=1 Tax=Marasmius oreades TaxID=181124 RepID=A0A9P7RMT5_9AGAR|nr:uncharacterized protein E1B28_003569 [Marasmius oreades]KAG7086048.1 hypothetical protein E1B28_003569 [Marasmius oreades]
MSAVLTSKPPIAGTAFALSRLFNAGTMSRNAMVMMYQQQQQQHPFSSGSIASASEPVTGFGVGIGGRGSTGGGAGSMGADPVRAAVAHLLSKAYSLPCSTAAHSFSNLVQPTSRFQLALDALLPILESNASSTDLAQRILVSFILYSLYAPHPIAINPFKSVLFTTFVKEREQAVNVANVGGVALNEPYVWVLWKILKGDGNDIGPYSPSTLARSPLPPKLRATNLFLEDEMYYTEPDIDDFSFSYTKRTEPMNGQTKLETNNRVETTDERYITKDEDTENDRVAEAMQLLLDGRGRVLTLSEQRIVLPMIPQLASSQMITPLDLAPIISCNPTIAYPLCVALIAPDPALRAKSNEGEEFDTDTYHLLFPSPFLEVLTILPPTLASFDLMGRLLRDFTPADGSLTVAELVKDEVLGRFVSQSISWLENAEREEREGLISDDRVVKGVQNLCRFYHSLIKMSIVDPDVGDYSIEMKQFSLRNSRFEEANALYRALATGGRSAF